MIFGPWPFNRAAPRHKFNNKLSILNTQSRLGVFAPRTFYVNKTTMNL